MRRILGRWAAPIGVMATALAADAPTSLRVASTRNVRPSRSVMFRGTDIPVAAPAAEETP